MTISRESAMLDFDEWLNEVYEPIAYQQFFVEWCKDNGIIDDLGA